MAGPISSPWSHMSSAEQQSPYARASSALASTPNNPYQGASGPGLMNTLSIQLQQISAVLAMAPNNPLAAGRAAQKITILSQDEETCRLMLEQPGSEIVLLQLASMVQLVAMPEEAALTAASHALEALRHVTRFPEGCRQLFARGSMPGRVMATRPPEEVVCGMMRDLLSGLAALVNAPDPALLSSCMHLLANITKHDMVWERLRGEPADSVCTLLSGVVLAMCHPDAFPNPHQDQGQDPAHPGWQATPFTNVAASAIGRLDGSSPAGNTRPGGFETACAAAEVLHALVNNVETCGRVLETPNYLEAILLNLTVAVHEGGLEGQGAHHAATVLAVLTATPIGQMKVLRRHPKLDFLWLLVSRCFEEARVLGVDQHAPYVHAKNRTLLGVAKLWCNLASCEAIAQILVGRADLNLSDILFTLTDLLCCRDAGVAANSVIIAHRMLKTVGVKVLLERHSDVVVPLVSGLAAGLACPEAYVAECACAALAAFVDDAQGRGFLFDHQPRVDVERVVGGLSGLMQHPDTAAAGIAVDALSNFMSGPQGETFIARFLQGGLKCDPKVPSKVEDQPGFFSFLFGSSPKQQDTIPDPVDVNFEIINTAYQVLDAMLLGLANVLRRPADKLAAVNAAEVVCAVCSVETAWMRLMGQPFDLLNAILVGLVQLARSKERAATRNAAVILHCFTLDQDGMQILHEQDRVNSKNMLLALHEMQGSCDTTTADLATGALSNLAQRDSWRARMQMLDMLNTFNMGKPTL